MCQCRWLFLSRLSLPLMTSCAQEAELQQWHERLVALETRGEEERRALQAQIQEEKDKRWVT
jgi:hypothetical protein